MRFPDGQIRTGAAVGAALLLSVAFGFPRPARAVDPDVRTVLTTGLYGILGGTVLGLVSAPFTGTPRSVFIGTSIGLYLGAAVGVFHVMNRYDPENPLHQRPPEIPPWERPREEREPSYYYRDAGRVWGVSMTIARF